jgi:soluble lytic murein transglycosylase-like protein
MQETAQTNSDLLNLTRWVSLTFLILLIGMPHLQQWQKDTRPDALETIQPLANESEAEDRLETALFSQKGDRLAYDRKIAATAGIESEIGTSRVRGIPGPMTPIEDPADLIFSGPDPEPAGMHVSSLSLSPKPGDESKSVESSVRKEKQEHPFEGIIHKAAERYEVDPALVKAIIMAESSYNPMAVSRKGAQGLMQLMPRTARALGVKNSFDPKNNIDAGVRYFRQLLDQFDGDVKLAIAAYNAGSRKVREYNGIPPFKHTRYYVAKVIEYHQQYQQ